MSATTAASDFILVESDGERHFFSCQDLERHQQKGKLPVRSLRCKTKCKPGLLLIKEETCYLESSQIHNKLSLLSSLSPHLRSPLFFCSLEPKQYSSLSKVNPNEPRYISGSPSIPPLFPQLHIKAQERCLILCG